MEPPASNNVDAFFEPRQRDVYAIWDLGMTGIAISWLCVHEILESQSAIGDKAWLNWITDWPENLENNPYSIRSGEVKVPARLVQGDATIFGFQIDSQTDPELILEYFKRDFTLSSKIRDGYEALLNLVLRHTVESISKYFGNDELRLTFCITGPQHWKKEREEHYRLFTGPVSSLEIPGIKLEDHCNESACSARAALEEYPIQVGEHIIVLDLGGATVDLFISMRGSEMNDSLDSLVACTWSENIGTTLIDIECKKKISAKQPDTLLGLPWNSAWEKVKQTRLRSDVSINFLVGTRNYEVVLTLTEFEEIFQAYLDKLIAFLLEALGKCENTRFETIVLTGGGALYPLVVDRIRREVQRESHASIKGSQIEVLTDPRLSVNTGLALLIRDKILQVKREGNPLAAIHDIEPDQAQRENQKKWLPKFLYHLRKSHVGKQKT